MISFREIADEDVEAVVHLWLACGLTRAWNDPYKDISFARGGAASAILVGVVDGRIAAAAMVGHDGHRGALYYVAVEPALQGKGFGRLTVRAAEDWLAQRGVWKINLLARTENQAVRGFYEKLGYGVNEVICMGKRIVE